MNVSCIVGDCSWEERTVNVLLSETLDPMLNSQVEVDQ